MPRSLKTGCGQDFQSTIAESILTKQSPSEVARVYFNGHMVCLLSERVYVHVMHLASCPVRYTITYKNIGKLEEFVRRKLLQISGARLTRSLIVSSAMPDTLLDNVWRVGIICGAIVNDMMRYAREIAPTKACNTTLIVAKGRYCGCEQQTFQKDQGCKR